MAWTRWFVAVVGVLSACAPTAAAAASPDSVYVMNYSGSAVSTFAAGSDGSLTQWGPGLRTSASATTNSFGGFALSATPNGRYLFAADRNAGTISTFAIGAGGLLRLQGSPVSTGTSANSFPTGLVVSPSARYLYVANNAEGTISTFAIGSGGAISQQGTGVAAGDCCFASPDALAISANGQYLYAADTDQGTISRFAIAAGGALVQLGTGVITGTGVSSRPVALEVSANGQYLFAANYGLGTVSSFTIGAGGVLTEQGPGVISGSSVKSGPTALALSPNGQYLYSANSAQGTIATFTIGAGGTLTQQPIDVITGSGPHSYPTGIAISRDGQTLYAANGEFSTLSSFAIAANGALTQRGTGVKSGADISGAPQALIVVPDHIAPLTSTRSATFGDQLVSLRTPLASTCQGAGGVLAVALLSRHLSHRSSLTFAHVGFFIDRGRKRTRTTRRKVKRHGRTVTETVKVTSYTANATATKLPVTEHIPLIGLRSGLHTLTVKLGDTRNPKTRGTIKVRLTVCT